MKKQVLSFRFALKRIARTINSESHMRFHLIAAFYVIVFSFFYSFSATQYAVLALLMGLIIALETVNTCIEEVCNLVADRYEPMIKAAKDAAAGAVLISAVSAVVVAVLFFLDFEVIGKILAFFAGNIPALCALFVSAALAIVFVAVGPLGIREWCALQKNKSKN